MSVSALAKEVYYDSLFPMSKTFMAKVTMSALKDSKRRDVGNVCLCLFFER